MLFFGDQSRNELRTVYVKTWRKHKERMPLEPIEAQVLDVIVEHPEYIPLLENVDSALTKDFTPEDGQTNPFLHMAMHLAVRDQVATDRPAGIASTFRQLIKRRDRLEVEHQISECLGEMIWQSQRSGQPPDEQVYLRRVQKLLR